MLAGVWSSVRIITDGFLFWAVAPLVGIRAPLSYAVTQTVRPTVTICIFCTLTPQGRDDAPRSSRVPHVWHRVTVAIHGYPTYHTYRTTALLPRDARTYIRVRRAMCHTREYMLYLSVTGRLLSDTPSYSSTGVTPCSGVTHPIQHPPARAGSFIALSHHTCELYCRSVLRSVTGSSVTSGSVRRVPRGEVREREGSA